MSNNDSYNFDDMFEQTPAKPAEPPMTEARIRAIASDQHLRDLQAMQQAGVVAGQRRAAALERAESRHPGFQDLYNNSVVTDKFRAEHPRTAGWIGLAESIGDEADIDESYDAFYSQAVQYESSEQPQKGSRVQSHSAPAGPFSLQEINRLKPEARRPILEAFKERIGDMSIDEADPNNETFKIERGAE